MSDFLKIPVPASEHAEKAYLDGYYVEAIQVLHGYLEAQLRQFLMISGASDRDLRFVETWDLTYDFPMISAAKALFIIQKISKEELEDLTAFNRTRNRIIHKLYFDPYEKVNEGIPKKEYDATFDQAKRLIADFEIRLDVAFGHRDPPSVQLKKPNSEGRVTR
jgi:hypothetical protein